MEYLVYVSLNALKFVVYAVLVLAISVDIAAFKPMKWILPLSFGRYPVPSGIITHVQVYRAILIKVLMA